MKLHRFFLPAVLAAAVSASFGAEFPNPYPAPVSGVRLTPEPSPAPSINGARVFGVTPGSRMLFQVPVSGERPMKIQAAGLPAGLEMNENGLITGKAPAGKGEYKVTFHASNRHGKDSKEWILKVGKDLCLTPPMGWSSWYSYSEAVSQENVLKTARLFVERGLVNHGWTYINIDDCWQGERGGRNFSIQPNERFPDMKAMCDSLHAMGLKAGIYSSPWMGTYAGFIGGSIPNARGDYTGLSIPEKERRQKYQIFGSYPGVHRQKADRMGPVWMFDRDARQWAEWGFDYVKVDWKPNDVPTTERIRKALDGSGRDIVLSLSNAAPYEHAEELGKLANLWRTTGDIQDHWGSVSGIGFSQERWQKHMRPGHWNDPDMLQIGKLGKPNQANTTFVQTRLSPDEQYTQVTLWSLLSAPLIVSCDLEHMDSFTMGLLTNDEVIAVDQDPAACPARKAWHQGNFQVWTKKLSDGSIAAGFFNTGGEKGILRVNLEDLGLLPGACEVRDLWKRADQGTVKGEIAVELNSHGAAMFRFSKKENVEGK